MAASGLGAEQVFMMLIKSSYTVVGSTACACDHSCSVDESNSALACGLDSKLVTLYGVLDHRVMWVAL